MKKKLSFVISVFIIGALLILLIPCIFKVSQKENIICIQYTKMNEMIAEKEEFFLVISREGCPDCEELKDKLGDVSVDRHQIYLFEYEKNRSETLISELQEFFPNFIFVPYVCYVSNGVAEEYAGEMDTNSILEWMDAVQK